jgi:hypothetical protein
MASIYRKVFIQERSKTMASWDLTGNAGTKPATNLLGTTDGKPMIIQPGLGCVGIGTKTPNGKLHVTGDWVGDFGALTIEGDKPTIRFAGGAVVGQQQWILHLGSDGPGNLQFFNGDTAGQNWVPIMSMKPSGNVELTGNFDGANGALTLTGDRPTIRFSGNTTVGNQQWMLHLGSDGPGNLQFFRGGTTGQWVPVLSLTPDGNVEVAGDIRLVNADCAEDFNISSVELVDPGTVMVLGDEDMLQPSHHAYDKRVAGVISGAGNYKPGLVLDKQASQANRQAVALMGKVFCKVDAEYAPIQVGDLLTTSETIGHAMKAIDPLSAFGAVIGKALRPLREGRGLIPVLIALQ